ncbi:MAG: hypothetical protein R6X17_12965 [Candidatus Competibacteraceae bacterium]
MSLNILIAPPGFKESLSVLDVPEAIAKAGRLLVKATEEIMRMVRVGALLVPRQTRRGANPAGLRVTSPRSPLRFPAKSRIRARTRVGLAVANPC